MCSPHRKSVRHGDEHRTASYSSTNHTQSQSLNDIISKLDFLLHHRCCHHRFRPQSPMTQSLAISHFILSNQAPSPSATAFSIPLCLSLISFISPPIRPGYHVCFPFKPHPQAIRMPASPYPSVFTIHPLPLHRALVPPPS